MLRNLASASLRVAGSARVASVGVRSAATTIVNDEQDLVVIGGGPGGYEAAIKAGQLGMKVTCIESRGSLGGTCLNVGCIPSKALLHSTHLMEEVNEHGSEHGLVGTVGMDLEQLMAKKGEVVTGLTSGIEGLFKKNKVTYVQGFGSFKSAGEVAVKNNDGTEQVIKAKKVLIATGSEVTPLPGLEIDEEKIVSSTGALSLKEVPKKMVVIGAGVIGLELGSVWRRMGADVTVVEFNDSILGGIDKKVGKTMQTTLKKQGMNFALKTKVNSADASGEGVVLEVEDVKSGKKSTMETDVVLVAIGRRPYTEGLGLENVGVTPNKMGQIEVDPHSFETSAKGVFAIGDCVPGPMLAHKASEEGVAAVEMMHTGFGHVDYDTIPSVVYTHPEVAWVGKTEEELKAAGVKYNVGSFPMMANSRARANRDTAGLVKILADKKTDRILGVHIVAASAGELIGEAVVSMVGGASSEDVARSCHAHPTVSEAVKEAAMDAYDKPVHI